MPTGAEDLRGPVVRAPSASSALSALLVLLMALFTVIVLTTVWLALG